MANKPSPLSIQPGFPGQFGLLAQQLYQGFGGAPASFTPAGSGLLTDPKAKTGLLDFQNYINTMYNYKDPRLDPVKPDPEPEKPTPEKPDKSKPKTVDNYWIRERKFGMR
jgi:hypothetical protein